MNYLKIFGFINFIRAVAIYSYETTKTTKFELARKAIEAVKQDDEYVEADSFAKNVLPLAEEAVQNAITYKDKVYALREKEYIENFINSKMDLDNAKNSLQAAIANFSSKADESLEAYVVEKTAITDENAARLLLSKPENVNNTHLENNLKAKERIKVSAAINYLSKVDLVKNAIEDMLNAQKIVENHRQITEMPLYYLKAKKNLDSAQETLTSALYDLSLKHNASDDEKKVAIKTESDAKKTVKSAMLYKENAEILMDAIIVLNNVDNLRIAPDDRYSLEYIKRTAREDKQIALDYIKALEYLKNAKEAVLKDDSNENRETEARAGQAVKSCEDYIKNKLKNNNAQIDQLVAEIEIIKNEAKQGTGDQVVSNDIEVVLEPIVSVTRLVWNLQMIFQEGKAKEQIHELRTLGAMLRDSRQEKDIIFKAEEERLLNKEIYENNEKNIINLVNATKSLQMANSDQDRITASNSVEYFEYLVKTRDTLDQLLQKDRKKVNDEYGLFNLYIRILEYDIKFKQKLHDVQEVLKNATSDLDSKIIAEKAADEVVSQAFQDESNARAGTATERITLENDLAVKTQIKNAAIQNYKDKHVLVVDAIKTKENAQQPVDTLKQTYSLVNTCITAMNALDDAKKQYEKGGIDCELKQHVYNKNERAYLKAQKAVIEEVEKIGNNDRIQALHDARAAYAAAEDAVKVAEHNRIQETGNTDLVDADLAINNAKSASTKALFTLNREQRMVVWMAIKDGQNVSAQINENKDLDNAIQAFQNAEAVFREIASTLDLANRELHTLSSNIENARNDFYGANNFLERNIRMNNIK